MGSPQMVAGGWAKRSMAVANNEMPWSIGAIGAAKSAKVKKFRSVVPVICSACDERCRSNGCGSQLSNYSIRELL